MAAMAKQERYQLLEAAICNLENMNNGRSKSQQDLCQDLCEIAGKWPEEDEDEDHEAASSGIFLRLEEALLKLPPGVQQQVVASFRPLKAEVSRRLAEWTNEFNDWLNEAGQMQSSKLQQTQQTQHLGELLQEVESSPQLLWYRQCPKARVKTKFLMAVASLVRALTQGSPLVKPWVEQHPALQSLAQKIMKRLFVLPGLGNILETWHDGRLACYNATLSLAAQRAADKMRDDLQVSLVSAVKRATANTGDEKLRGPKQALQLQMRDWPMSGCPLARALLEFLKSHAVDLGDLGRPSLREIPPHSLKPATLRNLLSRLDAFDLVGPGPISLVRLRFEAVAALAYKAVGTKPKARAAPPVTMSPPQASGPSGPSGQVPETNMDCLDYTNVHLMSRLIRRGLRVGDEDWRQSWTQFCWKKGISSRLSSRNPALGPPQEMLAAFVESHLPKLKRASWARSLLKEDRAPAASRSRDTRDVDVRDARQNREVRSRGGSRPHEARDHHEHHRSRRPREVSMSEWSSSFSESRRRKKRSRREKKHGGDFFASKNISPEVMMMRAQMMRAQMMGVSMVMNSMMAPVATMATPITMRNMSGWPNGTSAAPPPPPPAPPAPPALPALPAPAAAPTPRRREGLPMSAKPLAEAAAAARRQQASSIDMDDL